MGYTNNLFRAFFGTMGRNIEAASRENVESIKGCFVSSSINYLRCWVNKKSD
jgi:hypothetical protein